MKRLAAVVLALTLLVLPLVAEAQQGVPGVLVQQSPTMLNACALSSSNAPAVGTAAAVTITPPAGQSVYLCGFDFTVCQNGTSTANTNLTATITGLAVGAATLKYQWSLAATASICLPNPQTYYFGLPVKQATPGASVVITVPGASPGANTGYTVNAYYYFAP